MSLAGGLFGPFQSWAEAEAAAVGWDHSAVYEITRQTARQVRDGHARYERDGAVFMEPQYAWPVSTALLYSAAANSSDTLHVLDFGGALGTSYYQTRRFLAHVRTLSWSVVEQERYYQIGIEEFETDTLKFYRSLDEALSRSMPDVVLLSGVLQYLEEPYDLIDEIVSKGVRFVILDRTTIGSGLDDTIYVQDVPAQLYVGSYAMRVLSPAKLIQRFQPAYGLIAHFETGLSPAPQLYRMFGCLLEAQRA